jgi:hypothetical protein
MVSVNQRDLNQELLAGSIDMHVHTAPCPFPRPFDDAELAILARDMGLKAVVVKDHHQPTTGRVHHAKKLAVGIDLFGSVVLNTYVGGMNPYAVEVAVRFYGARVVCFPTITAAAHLEAFGKPSFKSYDVDFRPVTGISVIKEGELTPEAAEIIQICYEEDVCLFTGHVSASEIRAIISQSTRLGFRKVVVTHPLYKVPALSLEEQKEFAENEGVFLEYTFLPMTPIWGVTAQETAQTIRAVGVENCLMSSDLGNWLNPSAPEGFRCFIQNMLFCGIKPEEIEIMIKRNPAYLLNLK